MSESNFSWNATDFFRGLCETNRMARDKGFVFRRVSSLQGFEECLSGLQSARAVVAVSDESEGRLTIANTPHTRRVKTVFLAMRYQVDDMAARQARLDDMRELFRQFMSKLILEKTRIEDEDHIYIDTDIQFTEVSRYFFSGMACAFFQIATTTYTDLRYNADEWD